MLRHIYPFTLLWRNSSDCLRNGVTIYNNQLINHVKYMCVHSANINQQQESEKEAKPSGNVREIPLKVESRQTEQQEFSQFKQHDKGKTTTTYSAEEIDKFRGLAGSWWDTEGELKPLHSLNKLRVPFVRDGIIQSGLAFPEHVDGPQPLKGLKILDVGCGGGILCEPLARLGAEVIGVDAAQENLTVAELHSQKDKKVASNVKYIHGTIEEHAEGLTTPYDAVIASEVLEHVASVELFIETCISIIKPGGSFFVTTINKTTRSWVAAIIMAEYVLGLLPRGTHDWHKFVPRQDLMFLLEKNGCSTTLLHGMLYLPVLNQWHWVSDSSVNYALHAIKTRDSS